MYRYVPFSSYSSKVVNCNLPHLRLAPPYRGSSRSNFAVIFGVRKPKSLQLLCGIICVILRLAVLIQYWSVMDRQTHDDGIYRAICTASRGNNVVDDGPLFLAPTVLDAIQYTKAQAPSVRLLVYLLQTCLYNTLTTNRPSGVWALTCMYELITDGQCSNVL